MQSALLPILPTTNSMIMEPTALHLNYQCYSDIAAQPLLLEFQRFSFGIGI